MGSNFKLNADFLKSDGRYVCGAGSLASLLIRNFTDYLKFCRFIIKHQNPGVRKKLDIDFLLQEKSFTRLMEGFYDRWGDGTGKMDQDLDSAFDNMDAMVMGDQA